MVRATDTPLRRGDAVPEFDVVTRDGRRIRYAEVWQRKSLIFVCVPADLAGEADYADRLGAAARQGSRVEGACIIITSQPIPGVDCPGVLVADRWGEIQFIARGATVGDLPDPADVVDWLNYVEMRCPECEGEWR